MSGGGMRFGRIFRLVVGRGGGQGVEITENRIRFSIVRDDTKTPNKSSIEIWGLKASTRAMIAKPDTRCVLHAGYEEEGEPQLIFEGDVTYSSTKFEEGEVVTHLELADGAVATRDSVVTLGYGPGANSGAIIRDIARKMGLTLSMPDDVPARTWSSGLSLHGPARVALDKVTRGTGLSWSIQSGVLQVIRAGGTNNQQVIELDATSGLIGSPERERRGAWQKDGEAGKAGPVVDGPVDRELDRANRERSKELLARYNSEPNMPEGEKRRVAAEMRELTDRIRNPARIPQAPPPSPAHARGKKPKKGAVSKNFDGWVVKSLLLPSATPGGRIKLSGREAEGVLTIKKVTHSGDTDRGDWTTQLQAAEVPAVATDTRAQRPAPATAARQSNAGGAVRQPAASATVAGSLRNGQAVGPGQ